MKALLIALVASLAVNVGIVATFALHPSKAPLGLRSWFESHAEREARTAAEAKEAAQQRTADDARRSAARARLWSELSSDDLKTLVAHLRAAGFPPNIVRALVADAINERLKPRYEALNASTEPKEYWKARGYSSTNAKMMAERAQLSRERTQLMKAALGEDPTDSAVANAWQALQYGNLSHDKVQLIDRVEQDYREMIADVRQAMNGMVLPEDRAKLELLNQEKHADLAALLTPQELEDYELRTSQVTSRLRSAMSLMDASEAEFRTIYAIEKEYDAQLNPGQGMPTAYSPEIMAKREEAQAAVDAKLQQALGDQRAAEFTRDTSYEFQNLTRLAKAQNLPIDSAIQAYNLRSDAAVQSVQIGDDKTMSPDEKRTALKQLATQTKTRLIGVLGPDAGNTYVSSASWLQAIDHGSAVSFHGTSTTFRTVH